MITRTCGEALGIAIIPHPNVIHFSPLLHSSTTVIPHKAIIRVADRQFRMEYPCGCTPAGSEGVQQRLDREWLQKTKLQQSQAAKQGKDDNGSNDNRNAENSHPNNSGDATQDLSKFVRAASSSRGGLKPKAFAQRLETVAENKAAHHPKPQTSELVGANVPATKNMEAAGSAKKSSPASMESSEKKAPAFAETSPAKSIDSFANHVESPGKGNELLSRQFSIEAVEGAAAVPSISSQPILTFTPDEPLTPETSFCSFPHRGNSITSAPAMDVAINHTTTNPDVDTQDSTPGATMEPDIFTAKGDDDGEGVPTPIDIKLPAKALDTPMKTSIAQVAAVMAENRSTMPSASLPTPMRSSITEAAGRRDERQAATKIPAKALDTPMKSSIAQVAAVMAENRSTMPSASLPTPMRSSITEAAGRRDERQAATKIPAKALDTPMKSSIAQVAAVMAENRSTMPSASLPTPMRSSITEAAGRRDERQAATKIPAKALDTPMKSSIAQVCCR